MSSLKTVFICQNCGNQNPKWQGKCPDCDSWNSFVEEEASGHSLHVLSETSPSEPVLLDQVLTVEDRIPTFKELDRVLGGGFVQGALILVGGAPGVGKSTLLLQASHAAAREKKVLYVSGEESERQTKLRGERLGLKSPNLLIAHEISLDIILSHLKKIKPAAAVIDSIQTLYKSDYNQAPGSVTQVRECAGELQRFCKQSGTTIVLVGHITKEGSIAGPRVLEHIVDVVLYFEGENHQSYRLLRAFKNRFGSTQETGIFEMTGSGLVEVQNPSGLFLQSRADSSGSVVVPVLEGQRALLMEVQALVSRSWYGIPKRTAAGIDLNRMAMILAVLEKRCGLNLGQSDVYLNVAGGMKIKEPAIDLAVAAAVVSSAKDQVIPQEWIMFGEVGLGGEVRAVPYADERIKEAARIGFKKAFLPKTNCSSLFNSKPDSIALVGIEKVQEILCNF
ncbi:MAG: DNA repair protein RadA [Firmicutes bacterium]|nr:DNA repair protein RadA [Bacillota bacterium]